MIDSEIKLLLEAAKAAHINPGKLATKNPWTCSGNVAIAIQSAVSMIDPAQAAKWQREAGRVDSLETAAVRAGITPPTYDSHAERLETDADYVTGQLEAKSAWEAKMLASFDEEADKLKNQRKRNFRPASQVGSPGLANGRTGRAY